LKIFGVELPFLNTERRNTSARGLNKSTTKLCYSEEVSPLKGQYNFGFVMLSTLETDKERMGLHHGALPKKSSFMKALQSCDLRFQELSPNTGLYLHNKTANAKYKTSAESEISRYDYVLFFGVTHEPMPGLDKILQDTLRPRLYNSACQLVKRLDECYWSDQTIPCELETFIGALASAIRMELRILIRRQESSAH
jgi:hypothetical protein